MSRPFEQRRRQDNKQLCAQFLVEYTRQSRPKWYSVSTTAACYRTQKAVISMGNCGGYELMHYRQVCVARNEDRLYCLGILGGSYRVRCIIKMYKNEETAIRTEY